MAYEKHLKNKCSPLTCGISLRGKVSSKLWEFTQSVWKKLGWREWPNLILIIFPSDAAVTRVFAPKTQGIMYFARKFLVLLLGWQEVT